MKGCYMSTYTVDSKTYDLRFFYILDKNKYTNVTDNNMTDITDVHFDTYVLIMSHKQDNNINFYFFFAFFYHHKHYTN